MPMSVMNAKPVKRNQHGDVNTVIYTVITTVSTNAPATKKMPLYVTIAKMMITRGLYGIVISVC